MMQREASIAKETSAEALLGLKEKLLEKTPPVPNPIVKVKKDPFFLTAAGEETEEVEITWRESGSFNGGSTALQYCERLDEVGDPEAGAPKMVISLFQVYGVWDREGHFWRINPRESLSAVLTIISIINRAALDSGEELLHVVRANKKARTYFQRFVDSGFYHYCDRHGKRVEEPMELNNQLLFACEYPVGGLEGLLGKFVVPEAADSLIQLKRKILSSLPKKSR